MMEVAMSVSGGVMREALELSLEQIPVVLKYITKEIKNCKGHEPDSWVHEFVPPLEALKARIKTNPKGPITISPQEGEAIDVLAQNVVSFRAGPCSDDEVVFFRLLNRIAGKDENE